MRRAFVLLGFGLCACARLPAPGEPSARALFRDLERQVTVAAAAGWGVATERDWGAIDHGMHLGVAIGARALRTRFVFPGAAFGVSWERTFVAGADLTTIKLGVRVAFDLDL